MATVLALDLGTKCGWAFGSDGDTHSGTWDLAPNKLRRFEGGGMRFVRFCEMLDALPKFDRVVFEEVRRHLGVDAAHAYGGYMSHLAAYCEKRGIPYTAVPVQTIKKHATGKGNAKKDAMIAAAAVKWPAKNVTDDNEADALWLLDFVLTGG